MGERKVINKYYPPDFDPTLIPRARQPKNLQYKVRMMVPMSIRCLTCGEYIYKGKKFNARKETVSGEDYLGIKIYRFYIKCTRCSSEITIKTDPKNSDYVCEMGATRNFEGSKDNQKFAEEMKKKREQEEQGNAMKKLENRTMDNKMEMDILDGLDEIREINAKISKLDPVDVLDQLNEREAMRDPDEDLEEDERELVRSMMQRTVIVKRLEDDNDTPAASQNSASDHKGDEKGAAESSVEFKVPKRKKNGKAGIISIRASNKVGAPPLLIKFPPKSREHTLVKQPSAEESTEAIITGMLGIGDYGSVDD